MSETTLSTLFDDTVGHKLCPLLYRLLIFPALSSLIWMEYQIEKLV